MNDKKIIQFPKTLPETEESLEKYENNSYPYDTGISNSDEYYKKEDIMEKNISIDEYVSLKSDIREIKTSINWIKWLIPVFITIGVFISGLIVNSIKESNNTQYQMLDKKLDTIKELNSMQIQRDIAIEINKTKK